MIRIKEAHPINTVQKCISTILAKIDLSEGIKNVAAVHRLGTKDFQGGVMGENNLSDSDANVDSILGVLGLDTSEQ